MPKLKKLSGGEVIKILEDFGFEMISQRGSHVKLSRILNQEKQILTIPNKKETARGTLKAIYNQSCRFVSSSELKEYFFVD